MRQATEQTPITTKLDCEVMVEFGINTYQNVIKYWCESADDVNNGCAYVTTSIGAHGMYLLSGYFLT